MSIESPIRPEQIPTHHLATLLITGQPEYRGHADLYLEIGKGTFVPALDTQISTTTFPTGKLRLDDTNDELEVTNIVPCAPRLLHWSFDIKNS